MAEELQEIKVAILYKSVTESIVLHCSKPVPLF